MRGLGLYIPITLLTVECRSISSAILNGGVLRDIDTVLTDNLLL